jgi:putative oxidoreductase
MIFGAVGYRGQQPYEKFCVASGSSQRHKVTLAGSMETLKIFYEKFEHWMAYGKSPLLLIVRLYWGGQFAQTGWGKLMSPPVGFFTSLNIPFPSFTAHFIAGLEFFGGILLILGLGSRLIGLLLACNMLVAYILADREALKAVFSDPGKFYIADPYTFLAASVLIMIFGAGIFSIDRLFAGKNALE